MSTRPSRRRLLHGGLAALTAATLTVTSLATSAAADAADEGLQTPLRDGRYVVTLAQPPAATYDGGEPGLAATRPEQGEQLDAEESAVQRYRGFLQRRQQQVAASVGVEPEQSYTAVVNGFTAELTAEQAVKLASSRQVLALSPDEARQLDTVTSPAFLGLTGRNGTWSELGGARRAGTGTVVGIIDTGIWPEHPSFAGKRVRPARGTPAVGQAYRDRGGEIAVRKADGGTFAGDCQAGERFSADMCTDKLVSARYFADGFLAANGRGSLPDTEFVSPRDGDGHGSHTAGTAVGNHRVPVEIDGQDLGRASGMAPAAKLAVYKTCWDAASGGGCYISDSVAAIDRAVLDGVDVLNYSISGSRTTVMDPVQLAFLSAASAGVFVAASAGNSGPDAATVSHPSPWLTTVAASTKRSLDGTVVLGDGTRLLGATFPGPEVPEQTPVLLAGEAALGSADAEQAALCTPGTLDPARVAGSVVVCERGAIDRTAKSAEVRRAGGVGTILVNTSPGSVNADIHTIPTVHLSHEDEPVVTGYVSGTERPTAALLEGNHTDQPSPAVPGIAGFSSRGPSQANGGDVLKPDVSAPGVDVIAAVAPGPNSGRSFDSLSGTSMSSPHVAGLAALLLQAHPDWSPMAVKSAMMTTAYDLVNADGSPSTEAFDAGAGHVDPTRFLQPALVYDSGVADWLGFIAGTGVELGIPGVEPVDPSDLNQASIAVGQLAGEQTVTRRVTAVTPGLYQASARMPGVDVTVTPPVLNFTAAGQTKTFTVTLERDDAPLGESAQGHLTWSGGGTTVRSPMVATPVSVAAPQEVTGAGATGSLDYEVVPGGGEPIDLSVAGLTPGRVEDGSVAVGKIALGGNDATRVYQLDVAAGTSLARFDLVAGDQRDDLDLYVINPDLTAFLPDGGAGATPAASERIDLTAPEPGTYTVLVHGFASSDGQPADYSLRLFAVGDGPAGNATVSPDPLSGEQGRPVTLTLAWDGLEAGVPYLGWVGYEDAEQRTVVAVEAAGSGGATAPDAREKPREEKPRESAEKPRLQQPQREAADQPVQPTGGQG